MRLWSRLRCGGQRAVAAALLGALVLISIAQPVHARPDSDGTSWLPFDTNIRVMIDGRQVVSDAPAFLDHGRVFVPIRAITEFMGATVRWYGDKQEVTVDLGRHFLRAKIGSVYAFVDLWRYRLDEPPRLINGRTYLPLRFTAEAMGAVVSWDPATRTASIRTDIVPQVTTEEIIRTTNDLAPYWEPCSDQPESMCIINPNVAITASPNVFRATLDMALHKTSALRTLVANASHSITESSERRIIVLLCRTCVLEFGHEAIAIVNGDTAYYYSFAPAGSDTTLAVDPVQGHVTEQKYLDVKDESTPDLVAKINGFRSEMGADPYDVAMEFGQLSTTAVDRAIQAAGDITRVVDAGMIRYHVLGYNCLSFVKDLLVNAGFDAPTSQDLGVKEYWGSSIMLTPAGWSAALQAKYRAQITTYLIDP